MKPLNAGKYKHRIEIYSVEQKEDKAGFQEQGETLVLSTYADIKTTKGYTLIANNADFEKAYTNFTIRMPKVKIDRKMIIKFNQKRYSIEYLNNINEAGIELEIQAKVVQM